MRGRPRVVLIGFGPTALSALGSLLDHVDVVALARTVDADDPVVRLAARHGVKVSQPRSPRDIAELIEHQRPDCAVISSYNRILEPAVLELCPFLNVHFAPLPRLRGNAPVNWAILNGASETAITIHEVAAGLDSGNIVFQQAVPIGPRDDVTALFEKLNAIQAQALGPTVLRFLDGWRGSAQDHELATYGCARKPEDGLIDWHRPAAEIDRLVRALTPPFPGAFTFFGGARLVVHRAQPTEARRRFEGSIPGRVVSVARREGWIDVLTGEGVLRVHELRRGTEAPEPASRIVTSSRARLGLQTTDLLERIEALERQLIRLQRERLHETEGTSIHG